MSFVGGRRGTIALIVFGLLLGLVAMEVWLRSGRWLPRSQIIRGNCLRSVDGVPVWGCGTEPQDARRENRACVEEHPERIRILFFGSSITYGSGVSAAETFTTDLEERLNRWRADPGFCVLNFAQPGFQFEQKHAVARAEVARYRPALILWEIWVEFREFKILGEAAYAISDFNLRPDGFVGIEGVPDGLNRFLFLHSRLYEHLALRFGEPATDGLPEIEAATKFCRERLADTVELARSTDARLVAYFAPRLDRAFSQSAAAPEQRERVIREFLRTQAVPTYLLADELRDLDYLALRLDPCCHYNAAGHRALVPVMERIVTEQLELARQPARGIHSTRR